MGNRTCVYCGEWVSSRSNALDACEVCVGVAKQRREYHENCKEPFTRLGPSEFTWQGVRWFRWRGKWRVNDRPSVA